MDPIAHRITSASRPRIAILAASLVAVHVAGAAPAFAQGAPPGAPPPGAQAAPPPGAQATPPPGAQPTLPPGVQATPPPASPDDQKKAVELFKKAQDLKGKGKCNEALPLLRESYAIVPSPNSRLSIARCLAATNDNVAAYNEFEAVIADVDARNDPKYAQAREAAVTERAEVASKIALVTVTVANPKDGTRLAVAGKDIPREQWGKPIAVSPGPVDVSIVTPPAAPVSQQLNLNAGDSQPVALDAGSTTAPPPPPPTTSSGSRAFLRPVAYVAGGVGAVGIVMFAVAGGLANATYSDLDSKCAKGTGSRACPAEAQSQIDSGKLQKDVANAGLVIGAFGLAAGVTLFILSRDTGKKPEQPKVALVVGPQYLGVQGTF